MVKVIAAELAEELRRLKEDLFLAIKRAEEASRAFDAQNARTRETLRVAKGRVASMRRRIADLDPGGAVVRPPADLRRRARR